MKLEKAIEILSNNGLKPEGTTWGDYLDAVKLGGEALKAWKKFREGRWVSGRYNLPGETED